MGKNKNAKKAEAANLAKKKQEEAKAKAAAAQPATAEVKEKKDDKAEETAQQSNKPAEKPAEAKKPQAETKKTEEPKKEQSKNEKTDEKKSDPKPVDKPKETPKEDPKPKQEDKKASSKPQNKPQPKKEEVIVPEVVDTTAKSKAVAPKINLTENIAKIANHERIDENHQVDFLTLLNKAYLDNPNADISKEQKAAYKEIFDGTMCQLTLVLAAQLETEGRAILGGIQIDKEIFPAAKKQFLEMYGVDVKALPGGNDTQLNIEFENVPTDVKDAAKADAKATKIEIPDPVPTLAEEAKLDAIRGILSRTNASEGSSGTGGSRMGINLHDAMDWATKAWDLKVTEPSAVLAFLYDKFKDTKTLCLSGFMNKAWGSTTGNLNPFITHAIISKDFANLNWTEKQIANVINVMCAAQISKNFPNKSEEKSVASDEESYNSIIKAATDVSVLNNIIAKQESIPVEVTGFAGKNHAINGAKVYSIIDNIYNCQDSPKIVRAKLEEIGALYKDPIARLANYADESAYSKA